MSDNDERDAYRAWTKEQEKAARQKWQEEYRVANRRARWVWAGWAVVAAILAAMVYLAGR